jgi:hypothetical protein
MAWRYAVPVVVLGLLCAPDARAHEWGGGVGRLLDVSVEVEGRASPLYAATDGSGRFYFEAREGGHYSIRLANRTSERLGAVVTVDGLNVISGLRDDGRGRMYVVGPWEDTEIRGWRSSLADVRRFTFVDERASYAARSGKANAKMGWIEIAVYREQRRYVTRPYPYPYPAPPYEPGYRDKSEDAPAAPGRDSARSDGDAPAAKAAPAPPPADAPMGEAQTEERRESNEGARARSFPGTGWGTRTDDPAVVVSFEPEATPAERITLRYEYRSALVALGVLPPPWYGRDRLRERERGVEGFAKPPAW